MRSTTFGCALLLAFLITDFAPAQAVEPAKPDRATPALDPGDRAATAKQLYQTGVSQNRQGQFPAALKSLQSALILFQELENQQAIAATLNNIGLVYANLGQPQPALKHYQEALALSRTAQSPATEMAILNNVAAVYTQLGHYAEALKYFQRALAIIKVNTAATAVDQLALGKTLNNIGETYRQLGIYAKALDFYTQSLALQTKLSDYAGQVATLNNMAVVYNQLGQPTKAQDFLQQALDIQQKYQLTGEQSTLINLGLSYRQQRQPAAALKLYQQVLDRQAAGNDRAGFGATLVDIGSTYAETGDYAKALQFYQQAIAIQKTLTSPVDLGATLTNVGLIYAKTGEYAKAMPFYQQALDLFTQSRNPVGQGKALNGLGNAQLQLGQFAAAADMCQQAIAIWEAQRPGLTDANRISLLDTQLQTFQCLQRSQVAQGDFKAALVAAERGRARAFVELLAGRFLPESADPPAIPTLAAIQQVAKAENATLVEYAIIPDEQPLLYIWVVQPSGEVTFHQQPWVLPAPTSTPTSTPIVSLVDQTGGAANPLELNRGGTSTRIAEVVRGALDAVGATGRAGIAAPPTPTSPITESQQLQNLHQLLIAPIAAQLPTNPEALVIFLPQGPLFQVPFAALQNAQGVSLIDQHTLLIAPSIQALAVLRQHQQTRAIAPADPAPKASAKMGTVLIVGNPAVSSVALEPGKPPLALPNLPGAEREAQGIANLFTQANFNAQALLGKDATKSAVLQGMAGARVVHLATHGLLDDVKGLGVPGAIVLAPALPGLDAAALPPDDGLLTANEILTQKLPAELVVLSACDSGRGRITGDGVIGLSRSLLFAGTPSVMVSLWKVPDTPTAALMQEFYQQWLNHPDGGKARALRQAMLKIKQVYPAPLSWAAFTLIGLAQ